MLQILGYLGCVYLVFKGWEILLIARAKEPEGILTSKGRIEFSLSIIIAAIFAWWLTNQGSSMRLPR